jgi:predicted nucleic acid-binding protein
VVADASALVEYLLSPVTVETIAATIEAPETDLHVPALCDVEVAAALRRAMLSRLLPADRAQEALRDYLDLPLTRHGHEAILGRFLDLRHNFSTYDATYAALAEGLGAPLLTADTGLARAVKDRLGIPILPD